MSISPISQNSNSYLQQMLASTFQNTGLTSNASGTTSTGAISGPQQTDASGLSPFAQMMSELQEFQQSNPTQYEQVAQQIATNLQSAAQTAQASGNTTAATQLNQLASDFNSASKNGQLPSIQDLAQAIGGGHHHHHGHGGGSSSSSSSSTNAVNQLVSAFQSNQAQDSALNPLSIIQNVLNSIGD